MEHDNKVYSYIVAGSRPWNRRIFDEVISKMPGKWHFVSSPEELTFEYVRKIKPRYIFFLHWSWKVPDEIIHVIVHRAVITATRPAKSCPSWGYSSYC